MKDGTRIGVEGEDPGEDARQPDVPLEPETLEKLREQGVELPEWQPRIGARSGVYVDDSRILWRGKRWSHMYAESLAELEEFARRVGLKPEWLQNGDGERGLPHYDVTGTMREKALALGAVEVTGGDGTYRRLRQSLTRGEYPMEVAV